MLEHFQCEENQISLFPYNCTFSCIDSDCFLPYHEGLIPKKLRMDASTQTNLVGEVIAAPRNSRSTVKSKHADVQTPSLTPHGAKGKRKCTLGWCKLINNNM